MLPSPKHAPKKELKAQRVLNNLCQGPGLKTLCIPQFWLPSAPCSTPRNVNDMHRCHKTSLMPST